MMKREVIVIVSALLFCMVPRLAMSQFSPGDLSKAHSHLEGIENCTECHELGSSISEAKCLDCHDEIQLLIDSDRGYHSSEEVKQKSCISCHSEHHGRGFDATRFDSVGFNHDLTGYLLLGAHQEVECRDCHQKKNIPNDEIAELQGTYLGLEESCLSCHDDQHRGQLDNDCMLCHEMEAWVPSVNFDHNSTSFELKGAHTSIDCIQCHTEQNDINGTYKIYTHIEHDQCTDCHNDVHEGRLGQICTDCHGIWSWSVSDVSNVFNHDLTRYPLEGMHAGVECRECHGNDTYKSVAFANCIDCHSDYHNGDFLQENGEVTDCKVCHAVEHPFTWSSYDITEHQNSDYPLEGAHIATPCASCHQVNEEQWSFRFASNDCVSCHENVHFGSLSDSYTDDNGCVSCHSTMSWSDISFDHTETDWPLEGLHNQVGCAECHMLDGIESQQFDQIKTDCVACHDDIHAGQFDTQTQFPPVDCAKCHSPSEAWDPILFDHNESRFPLEGKHVDLPCSSCHTDQEFNGVNVVLYKTNQLKCIDCHGS